MSDITISGTCKLCNKTGPINENSLCFDCLNLRLDGFSEDYIHTLHDTRKETQVKSHTAKIILQHRRAQKLQQCLIEDSNRKLAELNTVCDQAKEQIELGEIDLARAILVEKKPIVVTAIAEEEPIKEPVVGVKK